MEILFYLLKSTLILSLFIVVFELFLKKETLYRSTRIFLLSGIFLAAILPYLSIEKTTLITEYITASQTDTQTNTGIFIENNLEEAGFFSNFSWLKLGMGIYLGVGSFFFLQFILRLSQLNIFLYKQKQFTCKNGLKYIQTKENTAPFSFFKNIVYNPDFHNEKELELILKHEEAHAKNRHSIDMILVNLMVFTNWFNPLCWLYRKRISENLEFLADREATQNLNCISTYQLSLLNYVNVNPQSFPVNNFHQSFISRRIQKLQQDSSQKYAGLKFSFILPFLVAFFFTFQIHSKAETIYIIKKNNDDSELSMENPIDLEKDISKKDLSISTQVVIVKTSKEKSLKEIKSFLKTQDIEFNYSDLKYDENGMITQINLSFTDKEEKNHTYSIFGEKPIPDIYMVVSDDFTGFKTHTGSEKLIHHNSAIINNGAPHPDIEEKLKKILNKNESNKSDSKKVVTQIKSIDIINRADKIPLILINDKKEKKPDKSEKKSISYLINKDTSESELKEIEQSLSNNNKLTIKKSKRNNKGEIIKISFSTREKSGEIYQYKFENDQGIYPFTLGTKNGVIFFK